MDRVLVSKCDAVSAGDKMLRLRLGVTSFVITRSRTWPGSQSDTPGTKIVQSFHAKERKKQVELRVRSNRSSSLPTGFTKSCLVELLENLCPVSAENALLPLSLFRHGSLYPDPCFLETRDNVQCPVSPESSQYNVKSVSTEQGPGSSIWILVFSLTVRIRQNIHLHRDQILDLQHYKKTLNNVLKLLLTRELVVYGSLSDTPYNHNLRVWDVRELRKSSLVSPLSNSQYIISVWLGHAVLL